MKKFIIVLALGLGLNSFAQDASQRPNRGNRSEMQNMTPEQRVQKQVEKMTKDLSLDAKQQEAVSKLLTEKSAKAQEARAKREGQRNGGERMTDQQREAFRTAMDAERKDTEDQLKTILTADQFKKYAAQRKENEDRMRERMRERREGGNGGFGGEGAPGGGDFN